MINNTNPFNFVVSPGLNFNDTGEFLDQASAWAYSRKITNHVDQVTEKMWQIFKKNTICITDPPYSAESHSIFPIDPKTYKKSASDASIESSLAAKNTSAIYRAIRDASKQGGGTVIIPYIQGQVFYTSALRLEDNVNLHIERGAVLKFTIDTRLYEGDLMKSVYQEGTDERGLTLTRFESVELMNYSPFIYAYGKSNIAITGEGILDGQASLGDGKNGATMTWHQWKEKCQYNLPDGTVIVNKTEAQEKSRIKLFMQGQTNVPVKQRQYGESKSDEWGGFDDGFLRPNFIQPYNCQNVLIEGITIVNSPMWEINPVLCDTVLVQKVTIDSHLHNNDGCDPECSSNVVIRFCKFDVGDDCIAIKCGRNGDGIRVKRPCFNIVIEKNKFVDGHGGVTIGSEITNGVKNIFSINNEMDSCHLQSAYRFKTNYIRGGNVENIYYKNDVVKMIQQNRAVINVDLNYNILNEVKMMELMKIEYLAYIPSFHHVFIQNLTVNGDNVENHGGKCALQLKGFNVADIASSCTVNDGTIDCYVSDITIQDSVFIGSLQAFDMKNVDGLKLEKVTIKSTTKKDQMENCINMSFIGCNFHDSAIQRSYFSETTKFKNTLFNEI